MKLILILSLAGVVDANCPYSALWMKHGPTKAAEILNEKHGRADIMSKAPHGKKFKALSNKSPPVGFGTCEYENPFSQSKDCVQLSGPKWNAASAKAYCDSAMMGMAKGKLTEGATCSQSSSASLAGYCYTKEGDFTEVMPMQVNPASPMMGTCGAVANGCTGWTQGRFEYAGRCNDDGTMKPADANVVQPNSAPAPAKKLPPCSIAPGPMGAAHQHASSQGYRFDCEEAPGRESPFMWPLRYQAKYETESLPVKSTGRKPFKTTGTVYYDFSRNWKRQDSILSEGGTLPFMSNNELSRNSTMLHRGSDMVFLNHWGNGTTTCYKMDMGVIGNVRPDWFMDNRGAATSTQYLGNQHLFHRGEATLVKQWRKKDFADMYFVMSMAAEPDNKTGVHWPLQRNDPGEGFGDDAVHSFYDHKLLTEEDEDIFLVDQKYDCPLKSGSETDGPPVAGLDEEEPSHLNVDETGWFEFEYTYSPSGPASPEEAQREAEASSKPAASAVAASSSSFATQTLEDAGEIRVCMDGDKLVGEATFDTEEQSWVSVGLRPSDSPAYCSMTPAEIAVVEYPEGAAKVTYGTLLPSVHKFSLTPEELKAQNALLKSPEENDELTLTSKYADGITTLKFTMANAAAYSSRLPLTWAAGKDPTLGYHRLRGCVEFNDVPACGAGPPLAVSNGAGIDAAALAEEVGKSCASASETAIVSAVSSKLEAMQKSLDKLLGAGAGDSVPERESGAVDCASFKRFACNRNSLCKWEAGVCSSSTSVIRRTG